jgi:ATP-dependent DNA ligase
MHSKTHEDGTHTVGFVEEYADDPRPYIVSLKIDGDSSLAHFDGKQTVIWNKRGRWRRHFHITDQITASLKKKGVKSAKIAGELYAVGEDGETLPLNKINSIIVAPKTIDRQKQIRFAGFDIVELDGEDLSEAPYEDRVSKVDGLLKGGEIMTVPFFHSKGGMKEVQKAWDEGMKQPNFEGLVLRFEGMAKSHKIKMKGTADLAVIGFFQGKSPGRLENSVAGAMLAWMLPNGDFVYAGKSVIGKSDKEKEKMVSDLLKAKVEAPLFNIGGRTVDSSRTHNDRGKGTFTMVKPWRVSEHDYRSINWSKKPVFRFSKGKVEIVGEMNAPTMHTPTFKRWRDDKSINAHDLRMEQVPIEGTGKWGQIDA